MVPIMDSTLISTLSAHSSLCKAKRPDGVLYVDSTDVQTMTLTRHTWAVCMSITPRVKDSSTSMKKSLRTSEDGMKIWRRDGGNGAILQPKNGRRARCIIEL